jgi:hypothetical protein
MSQENGNGNVTRRRGTGTEVVSPVVMSCRRVVSEWPGVDRSCRQCRVDLCHTDVRSVVVEVVNDALDDRASLVFVAAAKERTKPTLARHLIRSVLDTGLARTAENSVPSSVSTWCSS